MSSADPYQQANRQSKMESYRPLRSLVEEGLGTARALAAERRIAIDLIGSSLPAAIPPGPFTDLIRRLLTGAVAESRRGSRVEIAWHRSGGEMVLTVRDEGLEPPPAASWRPDAQSNPGQQAAPFVVPTGCAGPLQQLRASMDVIAGRPGGTEIRLSIPLTYVEAC